MKICALFGIVLAMIIIWKKGECAKLSAESAASDILPVNIQGSCKDEEICRQIELNEASCKLQDIKDMCCLSCLHCIDDETCETYSSTNVLCQVSKEMRKQCPISCGVCKNNSSDASDAGDGRTGKTITNPLHTGPSTSVTLNNNYVRKKRQVCRKVEETCGYHGLYYEGACCEGSVCDSSRAPEKCKLGGSNHGRCLDNLGNKCGGCLGESGKCNGLPYESCSNGFHLGATWCDDAKYNKKENIHCSNDKYGRYTTLEEAKLACSSDDNCVGIYDNNNDYYYLCPKGSQFQNSLLSCIYMKGDCNDGIKNFDEEDVDCGGLNCPACLTAISCGHDKLVPNCHLCPKNNGTNWCSGNCFFNEIDETCMEKDDYTKMKKSSCEYDYKIGKYNTLSKAKLACSSEKKCSAIQDKHCDDKGPFEMCSRAKTGMRSSSCVYKKRENLVFASDFIRSEKGTFCHKRDNDILKKFVSTSEAIVDAITARTECEEYCGRQEGCWGCSIDCKSSCQWNAIPDCGGYENWAGLIMGDVTQKPVCIDMKLSVGKAVSEKEREVKWRFGPLHGSQKDTRYKKYPTLERGCLKHGIYTLTCIFRKGKGWSGGFIEIQGHKHCNDFFEHKAMRRITVLASPKLPHSTNGTSTGIDTTNKVLVTRKDLIPRPMGKCPEGTSYGTGRYDTCICEDHCSWDICRLHEAPEECLIGVDSRWVWDYQKEIWVAQVMQGNVTINCGDIITDVTAPGTSLSSPNYPKRYPDNRECLTVIRFPQEQRISLEFLAFNVKKNSQGCNEDWVEIRDGNDANATLIGQKFCGEKIPVPIVSSGNTLSVYFRTDGSTSFLRGNPSGFKLKVDFVNGSTIPTTKTTKTPQTTDTTEKRKTKTSAEQKEITKLEAIDFGRQVTSVVLFITFSAAILSYLFHSPNEVMSNPTVLLGRAQVIFSIACFLLASYMTVTEVARFLKNSDASSISYKQYNLTPRDRYPTYSICLTGETKLHWYNDLLIWNTYGVTSTQYEQILKGENGARYDYQFATRLYKKIPLNIKNVSSVDFERFHLKLSDILVGLKFVTQESGNAISFDNDEDKRLLIRNLFYIGYQTPDTICFTRKSNDEPGSIRIYDLLSFKTSILNFSDYRDAELKIFTHYPGQLLKSFDTPNFRSLLRDYELEKELEFRISHVTVLRKRGDSNVPCNIEIQDDDAIFQMEIIKRIGCVPIYWMPSFSNVGFKECKLPTELNKAYHYINDYKEVLGSYDPPCLDMTAMVMYYQGKEKLAPNSAVIKFLYKDKHYQEIKNEEAFGFQTCWSSVGGFIGIFVGYSILQLPELLNNLEPLFRKIKVALSLV